MTYIYRREDNGELVEVSWEQMIQQEGGFITLEDGVAARRCVHLEIERDGKNDRNKLAPVLDRPIISDALGFGQHQLADFEQDRMQHGFTGVEFTRDPQVPEFYQVRCSSRRDFEQYMKHRGFYNKTGMGGVRLSQEELSRAAEIATRHLKR